MIQHKNIHEHSYHNLETTISSLGNKYMPKTQQFNTKNQFRQLMNYKKKQKLPFFIILKTHYHFSSILSFVDLLINQLHCIIQTH